MQNDSGTDPEGSPRPPTSAPASSKSSRPSSRPREAGRASFRRLAWWLLGLVVVVVIGAVVAVVSVVEHYSRGLPDVARLQDEYAPPQVTRIYARDGTLLANIFSERRTVVPFQRIPDHVKSAFLAAEDAAFFEHEGLDYLGMLRAMAVNLRAGRVKQGGSTITQQVVKNVLLDNERSYERKIRETILAYRLEKTLSKEQILGMYLNHIYLGHGRYGVEEAGRYYFGAHVEQLDVAQAALLAGIVAAPERFSPRKHEQQAKRRRAYVLSQMLRKGFMTEEVHDAALEMPVRLAPVSETESDIAPEMVLHAKRMLKKVAPQGAERGGYSVHTTIDPQLQVAARKALREGLDHYLVRQKLKPPFTLKERRLWGKTFEGHPRRHGIYVGEVLVRDDERGVIEVRVGDVHGEVHLYDEPRYNPKHIPPSGFVGEGAALRVRVLDDPEQATDETPVRLRLELGPQGALVALDPDTRDVLAAVGSYEALPGGLDRSFQTKRQPGSTFKPIVYSYGLSTSQITPATSFEFEVTLPATEDEPARPGVERLSLRQGIARSDNRVARQVLREVGPRRAVQWARALGIESELGATESLMLGAYEVTVKEMAEAYSVFASGGMAEEVRFISRVESGAGELALPPRQPSRRVMDPAVAYLTTSLLSSVVQEGTGRRAQSLGRPLAGKTGTTNKAKDAWFVGYSTELVAAVWVGFDDALPLGWGESGATSALPIWMSFMKAAHEERPVTDFARPVNVSEIDIDPATGLLARYGQEDTLREEFLAGTEPTSTAPEALPNAPSDDEEPNGALGEGAGRQDAEEKRSMADRADSRGDSAEDASLLDGDLQDPLTDDRSPPPLPPEAPPF